jgi:hypothetical protein
MVIYVKAIVLGCAATAAIIVARSKVLAKKEKTPPTPVASSSTQLTTYVSK